MQTRDDFVFAAQLNENAERYNDMISTMKKVIGFGEPLNEKERNLLQIGYKQVATPCRNALRVLAATEQREKARSGQNQNRLAYITRYRETIEKQLLDNCLDAIKLVDHDLLPKAQDAGAKVFYLKMKADYYRYMAEFSIPDERKQNAGLALGCYKDAQSVSDQMAVTDPVRLGLALNFSVFYYEILGNKKAACDMADAAFQAAVANIDKLTQEAYKDATLIMQLLRDNYNLWRDDDIEDQ